MIIRKESDEITLRDAKIINPAKEIAAMLQREDPSLSARKYACLVCGRFYFYRPACSNPRIASAMSTLNFSRARLCAATSAA